MLVSLCAILAFSLPFGYGTCEGLVPLGNVPPCECSLFVLLHMSQAMQDGGGC